MTCENVVEGGCGTSATLFTGLMLKTLPFVLAFLLFVGPAMVICANCFVVLWIITGTSAVVDHDRSITSLPATMVPSNK